MTRLQTIENAVVQTLREFASALHVEMESLHIIVRFFPDGRVRKVRVQPEVEKEISK